MAWFFFKKYLFSKHSGSLTRVISRLCVIGVAVSVCAMVVVLSVMGGFGEHIEKRLLSYEPHLIVKSKHEKSSDQIYELKKLHNDFKDSDEFKLNLLDQQEAIVRTVDSFYSGALLEGMSKETFLRFMNEIKQESSKQPQSTFTWQSEKKTENIEVEELQKDEVVIGADLAHSLGLFIGDKLIMTTPESLLLPPGEVPDFVSVRVRDIIRTNLPELDSQLIIYNLDKNSTLFRDPLSLVHQIEIQTKDISTVDDLKKQFQNLGFISETWKDRNSSLFYSLKMEKLLIGLFLGLALFIGSFSILTVLLLLATQKKQDIGILKTLGMNQSGIQSIFTKVGIYLSSFGILGGFALGLFICFIFAKFPLIELPEIYYDRTIPVRFDIWLYILILFVAFFVTIGSSWFPALWGARTNPSEAIRKR